MRIAVIEPFSGISGDMTLGALIANGLDAEFVKSLPARLGLDGVEVSVSSVNRAGIASTKVDFAIPPQPHGRHLKHIRSILDKCDAPAAVKAKADEIFFAITKAEAEIHGTTMEKVHLHEVGAVDSILDIMGSVWGFHLLGVERIHHHPPMVGDGMVTAAHGEMPVPAPATLKLLEGLEFHAGPPGSGELVTPTGAALLRILSSGAPPASYRPIGSGFGAGTRDFPKRANALRITLADASDVTGGRETLVELIADIDDMSPEYVAATADALRDAGALDVAIVPTIMKRGRPGSRVEVLAAPAAAAELESILFRESSTLGVRRRLVERVALERQMTSVTVLGHSISVKVAVLPDGTKRAKPEFADVQRVSLATGQPLQDIFRLALTGAERA